MREGERKTEEEPFLGYKDSQNRGKNRSFSSKQEGQRM
jgi:hypothetical protein